MKTVIIADDHPFTVEGMSSIIRDLPDFAVVATAQNGLDAIAAIKKHKPDCALLDLSMPGANGLEVFQEAKRLSPETKFAIVTGKSAGTLFKQLFDAGIDGLFIKNMPPQDIVAGIIKITQGQRVIGAGAQDFINAAAPQDELSKRERDVLEGIAKGKNNREIALDLGVSPKTVDSHRVNLFKKMNVHSTASLLVKAIRTGVLDI